MNSTGSRRRDSARGSELITDIASFLKYFDGVNRRAERDVSALPPEAEAWKPPAHADESGWDIAQLVAHMAASRLFFAHAYRGEGWVAKPWTEPTRTRSEWVAALHGSAEQLRTALDGTPDEWLQRKVAGIDDPDVQVSGWRLLLMMVEHDVHHRSQIDTYAGINGWPVPQIFGRRAEDVGLAR